MEKFLFRVYYFIIIYNDNYIYIIIYIIYVGIFEVPVMHIIVLY